MRLFNAALVDRFMVSAGMEDDQPIESKMVTNSIQKAQGAVEAQNYEIRKNVLKYDDVMNRQRQVIYEGDAVLEGRDLHEQLRMFVNDVVGGQYDAATADGFAGDWDLERLWRPCVRCTPLASRSRSSRTSRAAGTASVQTCSASSWMSDAHHAYDQREEALGAATMREVERRVVLSVLDRKWREHLRRWTTSKRGSGCADGPARPADRVPARVSSCSSSRWTPSRRSPSLHLFSVQVEAPAQQVGATPMAVSDLVGGVAQAAEAPAAEPASGAPSGAAPEGAGRTRRPWPPTSVGRQSARVG